MNDLLLLTHTNPFDDSRVMKYHNSAHSSGYSVMTVGLSRGGQNSNSHDITIVSSHKKKENWDKSWSNKMGIFSNIPFYFSLGFRITRMGLRHQAKLIHANDQFVLLPAVLIKILTGSRLIYDAHELESEANGVSKKMRRMTLIIERLSWRKVDYFVTVSPSIRDWYLTKYGNKENSVILNSPSVNPITSDSTRVPSDYFKTKYDLGDQVKVFLYLGALEAGRGIPIYLEALSRTENDIAIIFMGQGSLESLIKQHPEFGKKLFLHEPVEHTRVTDYARSADYGLCLIERVSTSDWLCLPNKLFEYVFADIPVVTSNFPELSRVTHEHKLGISIAPTIQELVQVLNHPEIIPLRTNLSEATSLKEFSWEHQERLVLEIYQSQLKSR